jgi:hypothetical protein
LDICNSNRLKLQLEPLQVKVVILSKRQRNLAGNVRSESTEKVYYIRNDKASNGRNYKKKSPNNNHRTCGFCQKSNHGIWECMPKEVSSLHSL